MAGGVGRLPYSSVVAVYGMPGVPPITEDAPAVKVNGAEKSAGFATLFALGCLSAGIHGVYFPVDA